MQRNEGWAYLLVKPIGEAKLSLKTDKYPITKASHRIGRNLTSDTVLEGYSVVSADHCVITTDFSVQDEKKNGTPSKSSSFSFVRAQLTDTSTNGTIVNGKLLRKGESCELTNGSRIEMKGKKVPLVLEFHSVLLSEKEIAAMKSPLLPGLPGTSPVGFVAPPRLVSTESRHVDHQPNNHESEAEVLVLRKRVHELEAKLASKISIQESNTDQIATVSRLHDELAKKEIECRNVQAVNENLEFRIEQLSRDLRVREQQSDIDKARIKDLENEQASNADMRLQIESQLKREMEQMKSSFEGERQSFLNEIGSMASKLSEANNRRKGAEDSLSALKEQLAHLSKHEEEQIRQLKEEYKHSLTDAQEEIAKMKEALTKTVEELQETKALRENEEGKFRQALEDAQKHLETVENSLTDAKSQITQQTAQIEALQSTKSGLEEDLCAAETKAEQARLELERLQQTWHRERQALSNELAKKSEELSLAQGDMEGVQTNLRSLKEKLVQAEDNNRTLRRQNDETQVSLKNELKSVSALLSKAHEELDAEKANAQVTRARLEDISKAMAQIVQGSLMERISEIRKLAGNSPSSSPPKSIAAWTFKTASTTNPDPITATERDIGDEPTQQHDFSTPNMRKRPREYCEPHASAAHTKRLLERALTEQESADEATQASEYQESKMPRVSSELPDSAMIETMDDEPETVNEAIDTQATTVGVPHNLNNVSGQLMVTQGSGNHQRIPSESFFDDME